MCGIGPRIEYECNKQTHKEVSFIINEGCKL